jgi:hypothetical protein
MTIQIQLDELGLCDLAQRLDTIDKTEAIASVYDADWSKEEQHLKQLAILLIEAYYD